MTQTTHTTTTTTTKHYSLWVGGSEVNDYPLTKQQADSLQKQFIDDGYDDAIIEEILV